MKKNLKLIFLFVSSCCFYASCKKDKTTPSKEVLLRELSITEAKAIVTGNWKIHYSYGGFTGNFKTQLNNSFFKFLQNDSVYLTFDNQLTAADKAIVERRPTNFGYTACIINFHALGGAGYSWIVDERIGDTLVLVDDANNPDGYYMTKLP